MIVTLLLEANTATRYEVRTLSFCSAAAFAAGGTSVTFSAHCF